MESFLSDISFRDRTEAGQKLAEALLPYRDQSPVVLALPRGGVVIAVEIAHRLNAPLDLTIPRKVGHPMNPEYAVCAVTEKGGPICNPAEVTTLDQLWLERAIERERGEAARRRQRFLGQRPLIPVEGKTVIIADDGIATGLTMRAAIADVRQRKPDRLVVAIPVVPVETAEQLRAEVNDLVALSIPDFYRGAVGAYYRNFRQVEDEEVVEMMKAVSQS